MLRARENRGKKCSIKIVLSRLESILVGFINLGAAPWLIEEYINSEYVALIVSIRIITGISESPM